MAWLKAWRTKAYGAFALALGLLLWRSLATPASEVKAFAEPVIQHAAIECIPNNQYAIATAVIEPGDEIRTARMYFRSDKYPDFYYVDMEGQGSDFQAIFPMPTEETEQVIYYVEAVSRSFDSARTPEYDPIVAEESECKRRDPVAAWFVGDNPAIVVGATVTGAPPVPPGFQAVGIAGFVSAAGVASGAGGAGGGIGAGTIGLIAGGAGGAAAVALAAGGGSASAPSGGAGPATSTSTTTAPETTTTTAKVNTAPIACFEIRAPSAVVKVDVNVGLDARCSKGDQTGEGDKISFYHWDLGDGREKSGETMDFISPKWSTAGVYTITLTVTDDGGGSYGISQQGLKLQSSVSHEITIEEEEKPAEPVEACFTYTNPSYCRYDFNAGCSTGPVSSYDWILDVDGTFLPGPISTSGVVVSHDWANEMCYPPATFKVRLKVAGPDNTDSVTQTINVTYLTSPFLEEKHVDSSFESYLGVAPFDGSIRGHVMVNSIRMDTTDSSAVFRHQVPGRIGDNTVEAYTTTPMTEPGIWRFDFRGAAHFVPGSIKVQSGQVVSTGANNVVFRLSGTPGERMKFTFQLLP